ncbi:PAS domain-containing protein [Nitrospirillum sp. BR 11828]|uniref:PAS domain-containing protein n=1 Tax=Nitrospirillum sp. BR 11828 TaxID=3104325 RepID=UPI002ACAFB6D|nr:PAS domain-containing protein [Nitrospirillum sp. BR 11828]MDZ5648178.1 PAS domain-containing protein [Nitrospirillum sp. BR 11828]
MLVAGGALMVAALLLAAALAWGVLDHPLALAVALVAAGAFLLMALLGVLWLRQTTAHTAVLRAVVEAVPEALAVAGADGRVLAANGAFAALARPADGADGGRVVDILARRCRADADAQRLEEVQEAARRGEGGRRPSSSLTIPPAAQRGGQRAALWVAQRLARVGA